MKLSEYNQNTLMVFLQQKIEENAEYIADSFYKGESSSSITYPPNGGLTKTEAAALHNLKDNLILKSALRKILANNTAAVLFDLLNVIDGTTDPDETLGKWTGIGIIDRTEEMEEDGAMLHDELYNKYWVWRKIRLQKDWKLDNYEK